MKEIQGLENEFFLDLAQDLPTEYARRFDGVFNHTTLEHIYEVKKTLQNLCALSKDMVTLAVPFWQQMHGDYGDFCPLTPLTVKNLFEENGFSLLYLNCNPHRDASVYIFAMGTRNPSKWSDQIEYRFDLRSEKDRFDDFENLIGCRAVPNSWRYKIKKFF